MMSEAFIGPRVPSAYFPFYTITDPGDTENKLSAAVLVFVPSGAAATTSGFGTG